MYKTFARLRTGFLAFLLFALSAAPALAESALYTVEGVTVDVTAENALKAREQAFGQAQAEAFKILASRMLPESEAEGFAPPESAVISPMIQDFEVTKEQLSSVRYVGTYTFRFKDSAVRQYFGDRGVSYSDVASKPMLVLPYYLKDGKTLLWSPYNLWMKAWSRADDLQDGLVPLVVPLGDIEDASDVDDADGLNIGLSGLRNILGRYGAGEAVVVVAEPGTDIAYAESGNEPAYGELTLQIYRTDRQNAEFVQNLAISAQSGENVDDMLDRAVQDIRRILQRNWKEQTAAAPGGSHMVLARAPFTDLRQWAETQTALRRVAGLEEFKIAALTPGHANLELIFQGDEQRLRLALRQADIILSPPRAGSLAGSGYIGGRYDSGALAPPVYELYLSKYAPPELQPVFRRSAEPGRGEPARQQEPADETPEGAVPEDGTAGDVQPQAGEYVPRSYEEIRRQYRQRF